MSDWIKKMLKDNFIEELGIELVNYDHNKIKLKMKADDKLKAPNGYIHGGAITSLADTACGIATFLNIEKGQNFTTIELKSLTPETFFYFFLKIFDMKKLFLPRRELF